MRILIILLLFCKVGIGQEIFSFTLDKPYPDRDITDSVDTYINKVDSLWEKYKKPGFERVDLDYKNNRTLQLIYDSLGQGVKLIEFYEDTVGIELYYSKIDSSYQLKKYEWYFGETKTIEYWYPKENKREFWFYKEGDALEKMLSVQIQEDKKIVEETTIDFFEESTTKKVYLKENDKSILKEK